MASAGKYSQVGTCFSRGGVEDHVGVATTALITLSGSRTSPIQNSMSSSKLL